MKRQELVDAIRGAAGSNGRPSLLRFGTRDGERAVVFHIAPMADAAGQTMAFVRTSELGWPDKPDSIDAGGVQADRRGS